jgi:hypothetical protein
LPAIKGAGPVSSRSVGPSLLAPEAAGAPGTSRSIAEKTSAEAHVAQAPILRSSRIVVRLSALTRAAYLLWSTASPGPKPVWTSTPALLDAFVAEAALATLSSDVGAHMPSSKTAAVWGFPTAKTVAAVPAPLKEVEM